MPAVDCRPEWSAGVATTGALALIGWILMAPSHSIRIDAAVRCCLQKNGQHWGHADKPARNLSTMRKMWKDEGINLFFCSKVCAWPGEGIPARILLES